jgi:hypothetical protein
MADNMFFSRDTKVYVAPLNSSGAEQAIFEIPVLDGFSFSQATNSSEITLNEMVNTTNASRRGRKMFNDSLAPAEWSFSSYARPFGSAGGGGTGDASSLSGDQHAVEEVLWAMTVGDAAYTTGASTGGVSGIDGIVAGNSGAANRIGTSNLQTAALVTTTNGSGSGALLKVSYTASSGALTLVLDTETGSGYEDDEELFLTKEAVFAALNAGFVTAGSNGTNTLTQAHLSADYKAVVNLVGTTANRNTFTGFTRTGTNLQVGFGSSNKATLGTANIYFQLGATAGTNGGNEIYKIAKCCVNEVGVDFDIDGITTLNWSGMGTEISEVSAIPNVAAAITEGTTTTTNFIRNRLTQLVAADSGGTAQSLTLTGGSITISNNMTYLTPETLAQVNTPLGHVTGTRTIGGTFTCYLSNESNSSMALFKSLVEDKSTITHDFDLEFKVGGGTIPFIKFDMPNCHLEVPTHSIDDVISLEVNFHALGGDIDSTDELVITYQGPDL